MKTDIETSTKSIADRIFELIEKKGATAGAAQTAATFAGGISKV